MSSFGRKLQRAQAGKPWREGKQTWEPCDAKRTQEILREVGLRGALEQAKGRYTHVSRLMMFELDDVLELFGPPPHGMPITKEDLAEFLRRAGELKIEPDDALDREVAEKYMERQRREVEGEKSS